MKVIIVDDSAPNAKLLHALVSSLDFVDGYTFTDPKKALDWCAIETPDLVILDYLMPELDGAAFLELFRKQDENLHVPVMVVTADEQRATLHKMLEGGAADFIRKPIDPTELIARSRNLLKMREYQEELKVTVDRLHKMATTDALTGLANRRHFTNRAEAEISRSQRFDEPLSIAVLDADRFKSINDTYGHSAGDAVLKQLSADALEALRVHDLVGRMGGEEFALCMPETTIEKAHLVCDRLRQAISSHIVSTEQGDVSYTVSIGVTQFVPDIEGGDTLNKMISRADKALYEAKSNGRNQVVVAKA